MHVELITGHTDPVEPGSGPAPAVRHEPRIFDSVDAPASPTVLAAMNRTIGDADLAAPPVVLPDFHHKSKMELPSSVAVATLDSIRPTLTSASVNCGMALIALDAPKPTRAGIEEFYRRVRERYPFPPGRKTDVSTKDVLECAVQGSRYAAQRFGVSPDELERVEEFGSLDLEPYGGGDRLRRELPTLALQLARLRFGTIGPSNHFVELQEVEEIYEPEIAAKLGVREGQMTLQYHAGGGVLTGEIGALFGRRKHNPRQIAMAMAVQKPLFHLATARTPAQLRERASLYFRNACPPLSRSSDEGQRLLLAQAAAMNYGFAFRTTTYAALGEIARSVFGGTGGSLVVDSPHNSIYEEQVGDHKAVVHRHNSCRAYPAELMPAGTTFAETGQAILMPGTNRTSSFLCVPGQASARALHSACHGAGTVISDFEERGLSGLDPQGRSTLRFRYNDNAPAEVKHLDDRGVGEALDILVRNGLARPVARMRRSRF